MADTFGAEVLVGHEVIDVEVKSLEGVLADAVHRDAAHSVPLRRNAHAPAACENALHLAFVIGGQRGAELAVHAFGPLQPCGLDDPPRLLRDLDHAHDLISPSLPNISPNPPTPSRP